MGEATSRRNHTDGPRAWLHRRLAEVGAEPPRLTIAGVPEAAREAGVDDECDPHRAELAWERQQAAAHGSRAAVERAKVLRALDRIAAGTYGTCEVCGRPIPPARLDALPTATRCVDDAE